MTVFDVASRPEGKRPSSSTRRVLLADRDERRRTRFQLLLDRRGYDAVSAEGPPARGLGERGAFDVLFCELDAVSRLDPAGLGDPYVVVLAPNKERERLAEALVAEPGIHDCLLETAADVDLDLVLRRAERCRRAPPRALPARRRRDGGGASGFAGMIGESPSIAALFDLVERVAGHDAGVLITGESGTGKELVARAIHDLSPRGGAFVAVNCGAIPGSLLESELFGYRRGAFTDATRDKKGLFEEAHGGTLFLDEIGEMPPDLQVKLLRVLQESEIRPLGANQSLGVDVRVVAATVRDLAAEVEAGQFRQDLYFRLNVLPIHVPPLRERAEDIPVLARHFLRTFADRHGVAADAIDLTADAVARLERHTWPGNVRELENAIERALVLADGGLIDEAALGALTRQATANPLDGLLPSGELSIKRATRAVEAALIRRALEATGGNRTNAAKLLEISHRALLYKIREYGLQGA